jgi:hypothetical protein
VLVIRNLSYRWVRRLSRRSTPRFHSDGGTGVKIDNDSTSPSIEHNVRRVDVVVNKPKTMVPIQSSFYVRKYEIGIEM